MTREEAEAWYAEHLAEAIRNDPRYQDMIRRNKQIDSLINSHNRLIGRMQYAAELLETRLNKKPKHLLARGMDGKLVGADRDTIQRVVWLLKGTREAET